MADTNEVGASVAPEINTEVTQQSNTTNTETQNSETIQAAQPKTREERLFTRDELAKITNAEKQKAYEQAKKEVEQKYQTQEQSQYADRQVNANMGNIAVPQTSELQLRQLIQEENVRLNQDAKAQEAVNDFVTKMSATAEKNPDFENAVSKIELNKIPQIIHLANKMNNTGEIFYELAKNPEKLASLVSISKISMPLAEERMVALAASIEQNNRAADPGISKPLSKINYSNTTTDNGNMTIKDLKKQDWLKA